MSAVHGMSPLHEVCLHADVKQVSPTLAERLPFSERPTAGRTPSPTDSSPSMPPPNTSAPFSHPGSGASPPSRSTSGRTEDWRDGADAPRHRRSEGEGPFGDTSTVRSMDDVLSSIMQGRRSWTGSEGGRSASLQLDDDRVGPDASAGEGGKSSRSGGDVRGSEHSSPHSSPGVPISAKQAESDKSFTSPLASSDASVHADSTAATPADLRADVDSILCGSFWRS